MPVKALREFLKLEASSGIVLVIAAAAALVLSNSPLGQLYDRFLHLPIEIRVGGLELAKPLLLWINDGLMAVFFFLVGLEIKREFLEGQLSTPAQITLPTMGALGGMVVPALIYTAVNRGNEVTMQGWAIPAATDIAFALGILALVGSRAPLPLKVLLTAIAIIDDLGAILIIALFYTSNLSLLSLGLAGVATLGLLVLNRLRVNHVAAYLWVGIILWVCVLKSGVHATLAGVITAFAVPLRQKDEYGHSLLRHLEHILHPWIAFGVLPLFAFANAGVSFGGIGRDDLLGPVSLGIALGLLVGKQIGVFGMLWLTIKLGLAPMPEGTGWRQLYAVGLLCGIGFTMSLFIGSLAFETGDLEAQLRIGVLGGSVLSALLGYGLLRSAPPGQDPSAG